MCDHVCVCVCVCVCACVHLRIHLELPVGLTTERNICEIARVVIRISATQD